MFALASFNPSEFVEFGDFAAYMYKQVRGIKSRDPFDAGFSRKHGSAESFLANSIRANDAHSCDYDSWEHGIKNLVFSQRLLVAR